MRGANGRELRLQTEEITMSETAWLIECGSPALYYCGEADWCSNANHARKFATQTEADQLASTMKTMEPVRVVEHMWL